MTRRGGGPGPGVAGLVPLPLLSPISVNFKFVYFNGVGEAEPHT